MKKIFNTRDVLKICVPGLPVANTRTVIDQVTIIPMTSSPVEILRTIKDSFFISFLLFSFMASMLLSSNLFAAAGDTISNTVVITYDLGGTPTVTNASTTFTEDRIINFVVTGDNGGMAVPVISNMIGAVMQFTLTNTGNDTHDFLLTALNSVPNPFGLPADSFDPALIQVFVESGVTPMGYQAIEDTAVFVDELASGDSVTIYVVSNLPAVAANEVAAITLIVQSAEGGAVGEGAVIDADDNGRISPAGTFGGTTTPGGTTSSSGDSAVTMETVFNDPAGLNTEDIATNLAQDVTGNGQHADTGAYQVTPPVIINKTVTVIDTVGGTDPHTGATLRYQLEVTVAGNSAVDALVISDSIPANTTYVSGSILLNGIVQTDADDVVDFSQAINILAPPVSSIEVDLGQDAAVSVLPGTTNIIIFDVTIN